MKQQHKAWAIDSRVVGLAGKAMYVDALALTIPIQLRGHSFAAWKTRADARAALDWIKDEFPKARVVRVQVTVEVV